MKKESSETPLSVCIAIQKQIFSTLCAASSVQSLSCVQLQPHGLQHTRLPSPSPTSKACSNSCPSSRWRHPIILSSIIPFSCLQSFPASGSFPISQFFASGSQSTGASASVSVLLMNIQDWFPLVLTGVISLHSKGLSRIFSNTVQKHQFFSAKPSLWSNSHFHILDKPKLWLDGPLSAKSCLCFLICYLGWSWLFFQGASVF